VAGVDAGDCAPAAAGAGLAAVGGLPHASAE